MSGLGVHECRDAQSTAQWDGAPQAAPTRAAEGPEGVGSGDRVRSAGAPLRGNLVPQLVNVTDTKLLRLPFIASLHARAKTRERVDAPAGSEKGGGGDVKYAAATSR